MTLKKNRRVLKKKKLRARIATEISSWHAWGCRQRADEGICDYGT